MRKVSELTYQLDEALAIAAVDDAWSEFAAENGAPELLPPGPLRKPILSFISDPTTRQIYRDVFEAARRRGEVSFPLRCDSPSLRRFLELHVNATLDGFTVRSKLVKVELRPAVPLLEPAAGHSDEFLLGCSWCKRFKVHAKWEEVEVAIQQLRLFDVDRLPRISHGMCESCRDTMESLLAG